MKPLILTACAILVAAPALFAASSSFEEAATERLRALTVGDSSGVAVLVARDGKIVFQGGFGLADIGNKTRVTTESKFRIGSITKQFTAAAILRLVEAGKLTLDDPLGNYFPDFPRGDVVRVRHLLTHTSGIQSYTDKPEFRARVSQPVTSSMLLTFFQKDPPLFPPGAGFRYNNSGYFLLGEIVERVSGKPLAEYLRETFFEPLAMKDTGMYENASPPSGMARGYAYLDGKTVPALDWDMSWAGAAGGLYSTVGDLFRWSEALFNGRALSAGSFEAATTPVKLSGDIDAMKYGFGLVRSEIRRLSAIGHGGGLDGWGSDLVRLPEQRCTVVVLTNALPAPPGLGAGAISHGLVERFLAKEIAALPSIEEDVSIDAKVFADYVGRFDYKNAIMTVTVEAGALMAQLTDQTKFRIFPKAKDEFFWKVTDASVVFQRDAKNEVVAARHTQGGNTFKAAKIPDYPVKLTPEHVDAFVGRYQYEAGKVMKISRDGTQLWAQLTAQPKLPIFPLSETEFEWRVVTARVKFVRDAGGRVVRAVHTQNGITFDAPLIEK